MKRNWVKWVVLALALMMMSGLAVGCKAHCANGFSHEKMKAMVMNKVEDVLDDVKATTEQKKAVFEAIGSMHTQMEAFHNDCKETHATLLAQFRSDTPDVELIDTLVDDRLDAFGGLVHNAVDAVVQLHKQFSSEQRDQLATMAEEHMKEMK